MNMLFQVKDITYNYNMLCQLKFNKITYGKIPLAIMEHTSGTRYTTISSYSQVLTISVQ